jgi:signal transduction histidine kinase
LDVAPVEFAPSTDWSDVSSGQHFVQFYESEDFLLDSLTRFISEGLRQGETCIVIATPEHRASLAAALATEGLNAEALSSGGRYVSLDATATLARFMVDGSPDPELFRDVIGAVIEAASVGGRRVRAFGEMVALLWADGLHESAIRLEQLWNSLRPTYLFTLFCGYSASGLAGEALSEPLRRVCAQHAHVIPAESYNELPDADERLRAITELQQKALSLQAEIEQRREAEAGLREALRLRDDFLSSISHDLRTPLTVLQGQAQILKRRVSRDAADKDAVLKSLGVIEERSRRMTELVDGLMDVARLKAGEELELNISEVDVVELVVRVIAGCREAAGDHDLTFVSEEPKILASWDRLRVSRIVENLLANAIKYSRENGPVTVSLAREPDATGVVVLQIEDEGIGIPEEALPHIFDPFYRAQNAQAFSSGTGLGLAGVRHIVHQHGGTIDVRSRVGEGSAFTVRLPLEAPAVRTE